MKKFAVLSAMAVLAVTGAAQAQGEAAAAATLKLRIVPVDVTSASPLNLAFQGDNVHNTVGATDTGRTRRFSIQYQIQEGAGFEFFIASLASLQMNVTSSVVGGTLDGLSFDRALLTNAQGFNAGSVNPVGATDGSGNQVGTAANIGRRGLHGVWRGGLSPAGNAGNPLPSNGTLTPGGINLITPLTLSQLAQNPGTNPSAWYGLYDFEVTVGNASADLTVNVGVNAVADAQTLNAWGAYEDGDPIPRTSRNVMSSGASFTVIAIPAPGALALVGLGGLVATRRRRA